MKSKKGKKTVSPVLQERLTELEEKAAQRGIQLHFDLLEAAGLKLRGGLCKIKGEPHFFIDRRTSAAEKIEILRALFEQPLPDNIPEIDDKAYQASREKSTDEKTYESEKAQFSSQEK